MTGPPSSGRAQGAADRDSLGTDRHALRSFRTLDIEHAAPHPAERSLMSQEPARRAVVLVDNDVRRDSRVQKAAISMAERGWDVHLVGVRSKAVPRSESRWRLGGAQVRLVDVYRPRRRRDNVVEAVRQRLGYRSRYAAKAWQAVAEGRGGDLYAQRLADAESGPLRDARWLARRVRHRLSTAWVRFRVGRPAPRKPPGDRRPPEVPAPLAALRGGWRKVDPTLFSFEAALGPVLDELDPDLIHANDFRTLGVAARAKLRAEARGRRIALVWDAHEYLPGIRPWSARPGWHEAQIEHEREYAAYADEVVTVSEELAALLQADHALTSPPHVVLNCPMTSETHFAADHPSVREAAGLPADTPILVYSGAAAPQRGLDVMVEALPRLEQVALVLVVGRPESDYVQSLVARATELGVGDRLHLLPYVAPAEVVGYLSSADVGVIPIQHYPNHEIALITKFFEYSHARLPILVSDVRAMSRQVRETGQGEVFAADDVDDFVRAARKILAAPEQYRAVLDGLHLETRWTWEEQAETLAAVYARAVEGSPSRL